MFTMTCTVYLHLYKMADLYDDVTKMADIVNINENLLCIMVSLILGLFKNG